LQREGPKGNDRYGRAGEKIKERKVWNKWSISNYQRKNIHQSLILQSLKKIVFRHRLPVAILF
jgi:hypothetical protein